MQELLYFGRLPRQAGKYFCATGAHAKRPSTSSLTLPLFVDITDHSRLQETTRFDEQFGDDKSLVEAQTLAAGSPSESSLPGYSYMQQPHSATTQVFVRAPIVWWTEYLPCHSEIGVTGCPARNPAPRSTTSLGMNQQPANRSRYFLFSPGTPSLSRYVQFAIWAHSLWITARDF